MTSQAKGAIVRLMAHVTIGPDPYRVLGVRPEATNDEIHRAYRRLARHCDPDRGRVDGAEMARVNDAWRTLRDPWLRAIYDAERLSGSLLSDARYGLRDRRHGACVDPSATRRWRDEVVADHSDGHGFRWRRQLRILVAALLLACIVVFVAVVLIGFGRGGVSSTP